MPKIKIDKELYEKIRKHSENAGYSSVDEFISHTLEQVLEMADDDTLDDAVKERLRGLGYLE